MRILHTSDLHLKEINDDRWKALETIIQLAKEEQVKLLAISGDLFDLKANADTLRIPIRKLFSQNPFKILVIPGNHDYKSEFYKEGMLIGEDVILANEKRGFEDDKVVIRGLPYTGKIDRFEVKNRLKGFKGLGEERVLILMYHGDLLDLDYRQDRDEKEEGEEKEERYMPSRLSYFSEIGVKYVLAGHYHNRYQVFPMENGGYFVYPGSPVPITKAQLGKRKANLIEVGKEPREIALPTLHYEKLEIELDHREEKSLEGILQKVRKKKEELHPQAKAILRVSGYFDSKTVQADEKLVNKLISKEIEDKCIEYKPDFRDINNLTEDELFDKFERRLRDMRLEKEKEKEILDLFIRAWRESEGEDKGI